MMIFNLQSSDLWHNVLAIKDDMTYIGFVRVLKFLEFYEAVFQYLKVLENGGFCTLSWKCSGNLKTSVSEWMVSEIFRSNSFSLFFSSQSCFCLFIVRKRGLNLSPYRSKLQPTFYCFRTVWLVPHVLIRFTLQCKKSVQQTLATSRWPNRAT